MFRKPRADGASAAIRIDRRYDGMAIALHWTIALLLLANLTTGFIAEAAKDRFSWNLMPVHKSVGLTILALSFVRIAWRLVHRPPPYLPSLGPVRAYLARLTHIILYAFMMLVPLTGWFRTSATRFPLRWFGIADVPKFAIEAHGKTALFVADAHAILAYAFALLAAAHVGAALHHHVRLKDAVLLRIVPEFLTRRQS